MFDYRVLIITDRKNEKITVSSQKEDTGSALLQKFDG